MQWRKLLMGGGAAIGAAAAFNHLASRDEILWRVGDVMSLVRSGRVSVHISATYALAEAARAHRDLESRATTGKLLLKIR